MTITRELVNLGTATQSVNVPMIARTAWKVTGYTNDGTTARTTYSQESGDETAPLTGEVSIKQASNKDGAYYLINGRISGIARTTNSVSGDVIDEPFYGSINVKLPASSGNPLFDSAEFMQLMGNMYSLWFTAASAGSPDTVIVDRLKFGTPALTA